MPCRVSTLTLPRPSDFLPDGILIRIVARALSDVTQLIQRFENILSHAQVSSVSFIFSFQIHHVYLLCNQTCQSGT